MKGQRTFRGYLWQWWSLLLAPLPCFLMLVLLAFLGHGLRETFFAFESGANLSPRSFGNYFLQVLPQLGIDFAECIAIFGIGLTFFAIIFASDRIAAQQLPAAHELKEHIAKNFTVAKDAAGREVFQKKKGTVALLKDFPDKGYFNFHNAAFYFVFGAIFLCYLGMIESYATARYGEIIVLLAAAYLFSLFPSFIEKLYYGIVSRTGWANKILDAGKMLWANERIQEIADAKLRQEHVSRKLRQDWRYFAACLPHGKAQSRFSRWIPLGFYLGYIGALFLIFLAAHESELLMLIAGLLWELNIIIFLIVKADFGSVWLARMRKRALANELHKPYSLRRLSCICGIFLLVPSLLLGGLVIAARIIGLVHEIWLPLFLIGISCGIGLVLILACFWEKCYVLLYGQGIARLFQLSNNWAQNTLRELYQQ